MKKQLTLIFFLPLFCFQMLQAQGWEYVLDEPGIVSFGYDITPVADGNYLASGFQSGIVSDSFGLFIVKLSEEGDLIWRRNYPNNPGGGQTIVDLIGDRSLSISPGLNINARLRIIDDNNGSLIATRELTNLLTGNLRYNKVIPQADGGFIIGASSSNSTDIYHFDANYNEVFYDSLGIQAGPKSTSTGPLYTQLANGNLIWLTWDEDNIFIEETDQFGAPVQTQAIPWTENVRHLSYDNGEVYFTSTTSTFTDAVSTLVRFDSNQNLISQDTIWNGVYFEPRSLAKTTDGYLVGGFTGVNPDPTGGTAVIIKTDLQSNVVYTHIADNRPDASIFVDVIPSQTEGAIAVGSANDAIKGYIIKLDKDGVLFNNTLSGTLAVDDISDCVFTAGETPVNNWLVTANKNGAFFGADFTDEFGAYTLQLDTGNFVITVIPQNNYWDFCFNDIPVSFTGNNQTATQDFLIAPDIMCPDLSVNALIPWVTACSQSTIYIDYCNNGTTTANSAYVEVALDSFLTANSSSIPWSGISTDNIVTFDLGDIDPFECGSFTLDVSLPCDGSVTSSYGVEVHIFPDTNCDPLNPGYSGAYIESTTLCNPDSVGFKLRNVGTNAMDMPLDFFIVEDAVLMTEGDVPLLQPQQDIVYAFPANGSTYTLIHEQVDMAPGLSVPIRIIEGCGLNSGGLYSTGFASQFSMGDEDAFLDIDRPINILNPVSNTTLVHPKGYGNENFLAPNSSIEYLLAFQNTGTSTANKVVLRDSLSADFDLTSIKALTASHDFTFRMDGPQVMVFEFDNIQLPTSASDPAASQGFLSFQIKPQATSPIGTILTNDATIQFDDQSPLLVDQVFHTLGEDFIEVLIVTSDHPVLKDIEVSVYPNPTSDVATFEIKNHEAEEYQLEVFDLNGRLIHAANFLNEPVRILSKQLPSGLYVYKLRSADGFFSTGKLIRK